MRVFAQLVTSIAKTYVGTNVYMAPERIKGEPYSIQADVWSLGITLFEVRRLLMHNIVPHYIEQALC